MPFLAARDPPTSAPQNTLDKYIFGGAFIRLEIYCTHIVQYSSVSVSDMITKMRELHSPSKDWHKLSLSKYNVCKISLPGLLGVPLEEIADSICGVGLEDSQDAT